MRGEQANSWKNLRDHEHMRWSFFHDLRTSQSGIYRHPPTSQSLIQTKRCCEIRQRQRTLRVLSLQRNDVFHDRAKACLSNKDFIPECFHRPACSRPWPRHPQVFIWIINDPGRWDRRHILKSKTCAKSKFSRTSVTMSVLPISSKQNFALTWPSGACPKRKWL